VSVTFATGRSVYEATVKQNSPVFRARRRLVKETR
jgi:hypothetical protein